MARRLKDSKAQHMLARCRLSLTTLRQARTPKQTFCVGLVVCDYVNVKTRETGKHHCTVGCVANADGSCPPPVERHDGAVEFLVSFDLAPAVRTSGD